MGTFTYDGNGNMTADTYNGITLHYNYLDLVDTVYKGSSKLVFTYDAAGNKLYKQLIVGGTVTSQRHYIEDAEVTATTSLATDGKIESVAMDEGRVVNTGAQGYKYEYNLQDHLFNNRVNFRVEHNGTVNLSQVQNYYPFGETMGDTTINYSISPVDLYQYSGKELQTELDLNTYDFGARQYYPKFGRWMGMDPLEIKYNNQSPYNYVSNNPLNFIDPDGMQQSNGNAISQGAMNSADIKIYGGSSSVSSSGFGQIPNGSEGVWTVAGWVGRAATTAIDVKNAISAFSGGATTHDKQINAGLAKAQGNVIKTSSQQMQFIGKETASYTSKALVLSLTLAGDDVTGVGAADDIVIPIVLTGAVAKDLSQKMYITYILRNAAGKIYVGRSSGYGDPYTIMMNRYYGHHMRIFGYGNPQLDRVAQGFPVGYSAIRGREQDVVDAYGGIGSPKLGNSINPIWQYNPARPVYMSTSKLMFGPYLK